MQKKGEYIVLRYDRWGVTALGRVGSAHAGKRCCQVFALKEKENGTIRGNKRTFSSLWYNARKVIDRIRVASTPAQTKVCRV